MIIGLIGNLGKGKTLGMTYLGYFYKYNDTVNLDTIVSNYKTEMTDHYVNSSEDLRNLSKDVEGIYLLDEIWAWMSSRDAMNNDDMIELILNSRKRGCLIIYTVQDLKQVDPILRNNTDVFGLPAHHEKETISKDHDVAEIKMVNSSGEHIRDFMYNAELYYTEYDTSEEVSTVDDAEKYEKYIDSMSEAFRNESFQSVATDQKEQGFNTKKEARSFLELYTDLSNSKKDAIIDEAYRKADTVNNSSSTEKSGQTTLGGD